MEYNIYVELYCNSQFVDARSLKGIGTNEEYNLLTKELLLAHPEVTPNDKKWSITLGWKP
jgi:hypothetical protein